LAPRDVGPVGRAEQGCFAVARLQEVVHGENRGAPEAQVVESPPCALGMDKAAHRLVARLQELLRACPPTELAPDRGDDLAAVVELAGEADQCRVDGGRELHRAAEHCCANVTRSSQLGNVR
jgi:hypothetical protein